MTFRILQQVAELGPGRFCSSCGDELRAKNETTRRVHQRDAVKIPITLGLDRRIVETECDPSFVDEIVRSLRASAQIEGAGSLAAYCACAQVSLRGNPVGLVMGLPCELAVPGSLHGRFDPPSSTRKNRAARGPGGRAQGSHIAAGELSYLSSFALPPTCSKRALTFARCRNRSVTPMWEQRCSTLM